MRKNAEFKTELTEIDENLKKMDAGYPVLKNYGLKQDDMEPSFSRLNNDDNEEFWISVWANVECSK